jgi:sugar transferase (PEP-CTERM/EpsH1 system associated)
MREPAAAPAARPVLCLVQFTLNVGGAEVLIARMARRFASEYRVVLICLNELGTLGESLREEDFPIHVVGRRPGVDLSCSRRLARIFRRERVDVVHAHLYGPFFYSALARLPGRRPPIIFTEHGRLSPDPTKPATHGPINRILLRRRDRVVAVGQDVRQALIKTEGFPPDRVEVIYNGIDLTAYREVGLDRQEVRRELGLGADDFVLIQVARLDPVKDHATTLRAMARLVALRDDVRLVIAGDGPRSGPIDEQVRDLGLERHVLRLGRRGDVPRLLGAADVALLTSRSEGIPLALIEAMAAGLPVVATRVGGVPEVVEEGRTGVLVPAGDDAALAARLASLAADPQNRAALGRGGRRRAFEQFGEDPMIASYDRAYRAMLGLPAPRRARGDPSPDVRSSPHSLDSGASETLPE